MIDNDRDSYAQLTEKASKAREHAEQVHARAAALYGQAVAINAYVRQVAEKTIHAVKRSRQHLTAAKETIETCWRDPFAPEQRRTHLTIAECQAEIIRLGWSVEVSQGGLRGESIQVCCTRDGGGFLCTGGNATSLLNNALIEARKQESQTRRHPESR